MLRTLANTLPGVNIDSSSKLSRAATARHVDSTTSLKLAEASLDAKMDAARELTMLLRGLVVQYRVMHGGEGPDHILVSDDIFASLERENDPSLALKRTASGHTFDGVPIQPKRGQSLPFILRP